MCRKTGFLFLALVFGLTLSADAVNIVWVSEWNTDANGVPCDQGWINLLEAQGYNVEADTTGDYMTLDPNKIANLEAADLIIISRNSNSGYYIDEEDEMTQWNSFKAPIILMTTWFSRSNRWQWVNSTSIEEYYPETTMDIVDVSHPVFAGVTIEVVDSNNVVDVIDETVDSGESTFITFDDVGNGILLARRSDDGSIWIAEWADGINFYAGTTQAPAGKRMLFTAGGGGGQEAGSMNLNEEGQKMFLNAVAYMLAREPKAYRPNPANGRTEVPRDTSLSWRPGVFAEKHNVYFGTVFDDVNEAGVDDPREVLVNQNQDALTYDPSLSFDPAQDGLEFNQIYYWRVDEVNTPPDSAVYKGNVWSFTTANFIVVDDFEDYNDYEPDRIFDTWMDGWEDENNGAAVGYADPDFDAGEHFVETSIIHSGLQSMPYFYDNNMKYSEAERPFTGSECNWTRDGVTSLSLWFKGYPPYVGGFVEAPADAYTMTATGTDIWDTYDEFHFAYKQLNGSCKIIAKVESLENTDPYAKSGIMIRDSLEPDSVNIAMLITPENGVRFQYRKSTGAETERDLDPNTTVPQWVRLERTSGGLVRAYYSPDGTTWTPFALTTISMRMPVYVGLVLCSHNHDAVCEAKFSNVSFPDTNVDPQWIDQDIGLVSNDAEPMYVAVSNSAGEPAVVYHDDPNAVQIEIWTEWVIPLQAFADQGVNLTNVDKLAIGFGTKGDTTKPGGAGTLYIDDIRLYRPE